MTDRARAQDPLRRLRATEQLSLVGDARVFGKVLRITPAREDKAGAFWYRDKQPVGAELLEGIGSTQR